MSERDTRTHAQRNRAIRQEELRRQLSNGKHLEHAVDLIKKINDADDNLELQKAKSAFDARMKIVGKYLPDLKATELTGEGGSNLLQDLLESIKPTTGLPSERSTKGS